MAIKKDILDQVLAGRDLKEVFAQDVLLDDLKKALAERALNAVLDDPLEGEAAAGKPNRRNGFSKKTVLSETSKLDLRIPRDREGSLIRSCSHGINAGFEDPRRRARSQQGGLPRSGRASRWN